MTSSESNDLLVPFKPRVNILITYCLQNDFLSYGAKNPSLLHIGKSEVSRLIGIDPDMGSLNQMITWMLHQDENCLDVIHMKAWNSESTDEVMIFSSHAIQGTKGADLMFDIEKKVENLQNHHILHVTGINPMVGSSLEEKLNQVIEKHKKRFHLSEKDHIDVNIGVIGLWTESTILFLLYELKTRYNFLELATCSALTASYSRIQHINAIQQLKKILNIKVFDSMKDFTSWLIPIEMGNKILSQLNNNFNGSNCGINIIESNGSSVSNTDRTIICYLFRDCHVVKLHALSGGFSGCSIFRVDSRDSYGHSQCPTVLKTGPAAKIATERRNFEVIEEVLGNNAPKIIGYVELVDRGAIRFSYASVYGEPKSYQDLYMDIENFPQDRIDKILDELFGFVLHRLYDAALFETIDLFAVYDFNGKGWAWAKGGTDTPNLVIERIHSLFPKHLIHCKEDEMISFPFGYKFMNAGVFLKKYLPIVKQGVFSRDMHFVCFVHGDLNGRNILVDKNDNVFLIDFEYTDRSHILKDITKLEIDILYEYTSIENEKDLEQALLIANHLYDISDLGETFENVSIKLKEAKFVRAWNTLKKLRSLLSKIVKYDRNPIQLFVPLLRYTLHMMTMDHLSLGQKQLAAISSCILSQKIYAIHCRHADLYVTWLPTSHFNPEGNFGSIGITLLPGRSDRNADMQKDMDVLLKNNVNVIYCFASPMELKEICSENLNQVANDKGIQVFNSPIPHMGVIDSFEEATKLVTRIYDDLSKGHNVVLTSIAGLGRCGLVSCILLIKYGSRNAEEAVNLIQKARGSRVIESSAQEKFIFSYEDHLKDDI